MLRVLTAIREILITRFCGLTRAQEKKLAQQKKEEEERLRKEEAEKKAKEAEEKRKRLEASFGSNGDTCLYIFLSTLIQSTGGREEEAGHDAGAEGEAAGLGVGRRRRNQEVRLRGECQISD